VMAEEFDHAEAHQRFSQIVNLRIRDLPRDVQEQIAYSSVTRTEWMSEGRGMVRLYLVLDGDVEIDMGRCSASAFRRKDG
jgi:hypothetical protein